MGGDSRIVDFSLCVSLIFMISERTVPHVVQSGSRIYIFEIGLPSRVFGAFDSEIMESISEIEDSSRPERSREISDGLCHRLLIAAAEVT